MFPTPCGWGEDGGCVGHPPPPRPVGKNGVELQIRQPRCAESGRGLDPRCAAHRPPAPASSDLGLIPDGHHHSRSATWIPAGPFHKPTGGVTHVCCLGIDAIRCVVTLIMDRPAWEMSSLKFNSGDHAAIGPPSPGLAGNMARHRRAGGHTARKDGKLSTCQPRISASIVTGSASPGGNPNSASRRGGCGSRCWAGCWSGTAYSPTDGTAPKPSG